MIQLINKSACAVVTQSFPSVFSPVTGHCGQHGQNPAVLYEVVKNLASFARLFFLSISFLFTVYLSSAREKISSFL